jgi:hypothetical protein
VDEKNVALIYETWTLDFKAFGKVRTLLSLCGVEFQMSVAASCFNGRVIIQTFSNHDYRKEDVMVLWENYIVYTLTNHFNIAP